MELITLGSSLSSQKKKSTLLNDEEKCGEEKRTEIVGRSDGSRLAAEFESWSYEFLVSWMIYLSLNPFTAWFWEPFVYFLS